MKAELTKPKFITLYYSPKRLIQTVIRNDFHFDSELAGQPLARIFAEKSQSVTAFLDNIDQNSLSHHHTFRLSDKTKSICDFVGVELNQQFILIGSTANDQVYAQFCKQLIQINNEQTNLYRKTVKDLTTQKRKKDQQNEISLYDELVKTNNELINTQRILAKKNNELEKALQTVKLLSGLIPICSNCKKIRNDKGYWEQLENYISQHSMAEFSHGLCPDCMTKLYPEFTERKKSKQNE